VSDRAFWSIVTGIGGLILIGVSAGPLASLGVFLCMISHHLEKHLSNAHADREPASGDTVGRDVGEDSP
jgi:hypothetical protein